jgi:ABC-type glycerol-3-phosphate transport system permease component
MSAGDDTRVQDEGPATGRRGPGPQRGRIRGWFTRPRAIGERGPWSKIATYVIVVLVALICIVPFYYILLTALKDSRTLFDYPPQWIPDIPLYLGNFQHLLENTAFPRWVFNTLLVAGVVTAVKVVIDSMAGYAFAKLDFPFKNVLFIVILATLMIPFAAILVPLYLMVGDFGLLNTYWALILPPLANPIGIFMMRSFIEALPKDLENAARLDRVSEFGIYWRIVLPLVKPGLVVLAVLTFLLQYTSFVWPLVAAGTNDMKVITTGLASQRAISEVNYAVYSAGAVMALIPITIFFLLLQRYFIAGSLAGALKQ